MWFFMAQALAAAPPTITEPLRTGVRRSDEVAVVIGNEDYAYLPDVPHAERDGDAVYGALLYLRGVPSDQIHDLRGVNREQMLSAVEQAASQVGEGTLWVYFAGHGAASASSGELMLVGDDAKADAEVFDQRSVRLGELREAAGEAELALLLDTCFTGHGRGGEQLMPGTRFAVPAWTGRSRGAVWTAAAPDQVAGAYDPARHGRFTYFLVGAMRGWADGELDDRRDGNVTAAEADAYVGRALKTLQIRDQQPTLDGVVASDWVLSTGVKERGPDLDTLVRTARPVAAPTVVGGRTLPLVHVGGAVYQDAMERPVAWVEVRELAQRDGAGRRAVRRRRSTIWGQVAVGAMATEFLIAGPLLIGMEAEECRTLGDCSLRQMGYTLTAVGGGFAAGEVFLIQRGRHHRKAALEAANRVLDEQGAATANSSP